MKTNLIDRMSSALILPKSKITQIVLSASHQYKTYTIKKRNGKLREINHPSRPLKALQRWLATEVISTFPVHESAAAYRQGKSILDNALAHKRSAYLLRMDFSSFFPSITKSDVDAFLRTQSDLDPGDIAVVLQLVCRHGELTIGAPTSPPLSNAMCFVLDARISDYCAANHITYTRYADDLFFSTKKPDVLSHVPAFVESAIATLPYPKGLAINRDKTRHSSKKGRRRVTGITLTSDGGVSVGRALKRSVRARIHKYEALDAAAKKKLRGHITYIQSIDPDFVNALIVKYGSKLIQEVLFKEI